MIAIAGVWNNRLGCALIEFFTQFGAIIGFVSEHPFRPLDPAHETGTLRSQDLKRVTVDTTVQSKAITIPTDAELLHAAIKGLNHLARRHGVRSGNPMLARPRPPR
ncbi:hypothetical protein GGD66_002183 [Bradyrhizobium sp. CIR48]|nr:hypothetical protein [Bradyrhizobium sp. CIR48]